MKRLASLLVSMTVAAAAAAQHIPEECLRACDSLGEEVPAGAGGAGGQGVRLRYILHAARRAVAVHEPECAARRGAAAS